ncbi:MAG TPA: nitrilase-related carbon-nitrogen hydrolase [Candidatus Angelobacter sp.]|jgi:nitrilase|nr:nitrilase-related carbon-nitrogen hydrolase [Candidatus Angelobacter sp.]
MKRAVKKEPVGRTVTVAVVQAASVAFDNKKTLAKAIDLTQDAARLGAKLVLFPEAFISGYPRGLDFGAVVGGRTDAGREDFKRYFESAVDVPGPIVDALSKAARANSVYLVMGVIERERGTLYCCVLFFAPDGTFMGKHRKVMPTASERLIWGYGDGSTLPVFDTPLGKLGAVICWENYMPLLRTFMYSQGVEIYCAPTADHRPVWSATMQHIAAEGRCFVLGCNQFNRRSDFPKNYSTAFREKPDTVLSRGGSCIVGPFGEFLAGPNFEEETILVAELDRGLLPKAKFDFDVVGHYSRPDIFSLTVDDRAKPSVAILSSKAKPSRAE